MASVQCDDRLDGQWIRRILHYLFCVPGPHQQLVTKFFDGAKQGKQLIDLGLIQPEPLDVSEGQGIG